MEREIEKREIGECYLEIDGQSDIRLSERLQTVEPSSSGSLVVARSSTDQLLVALFQFERLRVPAVLLHVAQQTNQLQWTATSDPVDEPER